MADIVFTTGPSPIPDVGKLAYNGVTFSSLFETKVTGKVVHDNANRTTKFVEYVLTADGYATLPAGASDINPTMKTLRTLLTAQGGALVYQGRGFDLVVNAVGGALQPGRLNNNVGISDAAWGPVPELLEFQPLGAGRSAKVQWRVTARVPEINQRFGLLQFNYETTVAYGEDQFSTLSVRGTLEIPLTRFPNQQSRIVPSTADQYRDLISRRILTGIDLSRFRVTRREFNVSRDKRTLEFDVTAEELPYMNPPIDCTLARGTYNVRPAKTGMGLVTWLCTLKGVYTLRNGAARREAWLAFLALLRVRMNLSASGDPPKISEEQKPKKPGFLKKLGRGLGGAAIGFLGSGGNPFVGFGAGALALFTTPDEPGVDGVKNANRSVWLIDFSVDEGLYLDSKTVSFSATWRLLTKFSHILLASGLWAKCPEQDAQGNNLWAASMRNISGTRSWLENKVDPSLDVIIDFGSEV